ncbi:hypothetical protein DEJ50_10800 [Streptomyces venezuelae]|uniref:Integrase n=1 Tax=Streptomyces venezuelae TaxID=54571 RepID=A0A5P2D0H1_STRVZ|nr:hypothetical protein DEJ50_10800 [Streptomyces venezuelae]
MQRHHDTRLLLDLAADPSGRTTSGTPYSPRGSTRGWTPTEVAARAGNSVEVLLGRYAKCLDGRQEAGNCRIEELLREYE